MARAPLATLADWAGAGAAVLVVACFALFVVFAIPQRADAATLSIASSTRPAPPCPVAACVVPGLEASFLMGFISGNVS